MAPASAIVRPRARLLDRADRFTDPVRREGSPAPPERGRTRALAAALIDAPGA